MRKVLRFVALTCAAAATLDGWLSVRGGRRLKPRRYLRDAGILLAISCVAAGPFLAVPLFPGLVLAWVAFAWLGERDAQPSV